METPASTPTVIHPEDMALILRSLTVGESVEFFDNGNLMMVRGVIYFQDPNAPRITSK
jgi:hypothetical protein